MTRFFAFWTKSRGLRGPLVYLFPEKRIEPSSSATIHVGISVGTVGTHRKYAMPLSFCLPSSCGNKGISDGVLGHDVRCAFGALSLQVNKPDCSASHPSSTLSFKSQKA